VSEIKLESTEISPVEFDVKASVAHSEIEKLLEEGYEEVSNSVQIKGFRKGKAPRKVVERMFRKKILNDIEQRLVEDALRQTYPQLGLDPLAVQKFNKPENFNGESDLNFSFIIETRPKIGDVLLDGLKVEEERIVIEEEAVTHELDAMRRQLAVMETVEDRDVVEASDWILCDIEQQLGTETPRKNEGVQLQLDNEHIFPEIKNAIIGKKIGEEFEAEAKYEEDMPNKNLAGKFVRFKGIINKIQKQVIPEANDEFAKETGMAETLEGLKNEIRSRLTKMHEGRVRRDFTDKLWDAIVAQNEVPIPPTLLKEQTEKLREQREKEMKSYGLDISVMGLDKDPEKMANYMAGIEKQARNLLSAVFIQEKLAGEYKIEVSEKDLDAELAKRAEEYGVPLARMRAQFGEGENRENLRYELRNLKLVELLREKVEVVPVDPPKMPEHNHEHGEGCDCGCEHGHDENCDCDDCKEDKPAE